MMRFQYISAVCALIFSISTLNVKGQQDAMYTHYAFNTLSVNSGYAGSRDALTVTGLGRFQWVGFEGAPITQTLTVHTPIYKENFGVGLSRINDKIGPLNTTAFYIDAAYHLKVNSRGHRLAMGLKGGGNLVQGDLNSVSTTDSDDPSFTNQVPTQFLPNVGVGGYYYTDRWYVGLSAPKLLENSLGNGASSSKESRHYFLIAGFLVDLNKSFKLKPSSFVKITSSTPIEADVSALLIYRDLLWGGGMFRTGDAFGLLAGVNITPQWALGYSFDYSYGLKTLTYNGGSHEIMIRYDFIYKSKGKIKSPRYF